MASKIGVGIFQNAYGHGANVVTAGQKDYQMRMMQIEKQREDYYRKLGTPPGVPTMKGATAEPENTHEGYNSIIKELGDHSVPDGWIQRPKRNAVPGTPPGPPVQWDKAEDPDDVQPGYGYVPADTTHEDIFFYHTDHLGSTSYITDAKANVAQFDAYLPYGELLVDEHSSTEEMPYKFNGKELDEETGLYYYGARYMNPKTSLWYGVDPLAEKYPAISSYVYCLDNPILHIDMYGKDVKIWYVDKYGKNRLFRYDGTQKRVPKNTFVLDVVHTYNYLKYKKAGEEFRRAVTDHNIEIEIQESSYETMYDNSERRYTVFWMSRKGVITSDGGKQSPATALNHEFDHALDDIKDHKSHQERENTLDYKYDNAEERRVIMGSERKTAKKLGESIRKDHKGKNYDVVDPRTTKAKKKR